MKKYKNSDRDALLKIIDTVPHYIFWKDTSLAFRGCNKLFADQFGLTTPSEIVGKTDDDFPWSSELREKYREDDLTIIRTEKSKLNYEETQLQSDGSTKTVLVSKVPYYDDDNKLIGILGVYADITDRKIAEAALIRAENLALKESLSKTRVLGVLHKEVFDVVETAVSFLKIAALPTCENPRALANKAIKSTEKLDEIFGVVSDYLSAERKDENSEYSGEAVNVKSNILLYMNDYGAIWDDVDASLSYKDESCAVTKGNGRAIRKILRVIIRNAYRFAHKKVKIIATRREKTETGEFLEISIHNDGAHIQEGDVEYILNMFNMLEEDLAYRTLGPNLALVNLMIQKSGGYLTIDSNEKHGTTIQVGIPFVESDSISREKIRVLIVDDNEISRKAQKLILEERGCIVDDAGSAEESFAYISTSYDLILMDLSLPAMSGVDATRCFRNSGANMHTPVVAVTANPVNDVQNDCIRANLDEVVAKPLRSGDLEGILERYCLQF